MEGSRSGLKGAPELEEEQQGVGGAGFLGMEDFSFGERVNGTQNGNGTEKFFDTVEEREKSIEVPQERRESVDTTFSAVNSTDGASHVGVAPPKRKRGRPRGSRTTKLAVPDSIPASPPPKAFSPPPPRPDITPGTLRTSRRTQKPPSTIYEPETSVPKPRGRANAAATPPTSSREETKPVRKVTYTPYEELQREDDERDRAAGISRAYLNLPLPPRPINSDKPTKGRQRQGSKVSTVVFKSKKLCDPQYLEKNKGSWVQAYSAIRATMAIAAEELANAQKRDATAVEEDGDGEGAEAPPKKKRKWTRRKERSVEQPEPTAEANIAESAEQQEPVPDLHNPSQQESAPRQQESATIQRDSTPVQQEVAAVQQKSAPTQQASISASQIVTEPPVSSEPVGVPEGAPSAFEPENVQSASEPVVDLPAAGSGNYATAGSTLAINTSASARHSQPSPAHNTFFTNAFSPYAPRSTEFYASPYQSARPPSTLGTMIQNNSTQRPYQSPFQPAPNSTPNKPYQSPFQAIPSPTPLPYQSQFQPSPSPVPTTNYKSPYASANTSAATTAPTIPQLPVSTPSHTPTSQDSAPRPESASSKASTAATAPSASQHSVPTPSQDPTPQDTALKPESASATSSTATTDLSVSKPSFPTPSQSPAPSDTVPELAMIANVLQTATPAKPYRSPYALNNGFTTTEASASYPNFHNPSSHTPRLPQAQFQRPTSTPIPSQFPPPNRASAQTQNPAEVTRQQHHQHSHFGSGINSSTPTITPDEPHTPVEIATQQNRQYGQFGPSAQSSAAANISASSFSPVETVRQQNLAYSQFNSGSSSTSPQANVFIQPSTVPSHGWTAPKARPAILSTQSFNQNHGQASWTQIAQSPLQAQTAVSHKRVISDFSDSPVVSAAKRYQSTPETYLSAGEGQEQTPQTSVPEQTTVAQKRSLSDLLETPIFPIPKRIRSSLEKSRPSKAGSTTTRISRKKKEAVASTPQNHTPSIRRSSTPGLSTELTPLENSSPTPVRSSEDEERLEDAEIPTAESIEVLDAAARLSSVLNGRVGNLILSMDKFTLTFIGINQKPPEMPYLTLQVSDITSNPSPSASGSKRMELTIKTREENGSKVTHRFRVKATENAFEILSAMRYEIVQGMVIVDLQRRIMEEGSQSQNKASEPKTVDKPFKCDTCDRSWLNREGIKYHKKHSHTFCNPSWVQQTWWQAPTFLPNSETGAWDQMLGSDTLPKRHYRKKEKKVAQDSKRPLKAKALQRTKEVSTMLWQQTPAFLPNPETGAWNQNPAPPAHLAPKRLAGKKRKNTVDTPPELETEQDVVEQPESSVEDDEEDFLEWLDRQEGSRKRQKRYSTSSESTDVYVPGPDVEDDIPFDEDLSESDLPYGEVVPSKKAMQYDPLKVDQAHNMKKRWAQAKALGKTSLAGLPKPVNSTSGPRSKGLGPRGSGSRGISSRRVDAGIKNRMTEAEKAARRARGVLRQQIWTQPVQFLQNATTGAWNQPLITRPSRKGLVYQRRYRLPAPITYMQASNGTWSFRPFGHGAPPIFARPARRTDGNPSLPSYLSRVEGGHRPVLMPKKFKLGPAVPSLQFIRKLGQTDSADSPGFDEMFRPTHLPGLPGPHSSDINAAGTKKRTRRKRRQESMDIDVDEFGPSKKLKTKSAYTRRQSTATDFIDDEEDGFESPRARRKYSQRQSSVTDTLEDDDDLTDTVEDNSRRPIRPARSTRLATDSYDPLAPLERPMPSKLDPQVGRHTNPGLNSLPKSFGLHAYRRLRGQRSAPEPAAKPAENLPVTDWPSITFQDGSFQAEGWWPDSKWFLDKNSSVDLSLIDALTRKRNSSQGKPKQTDQQQAGFDSDVEEIAKWEQAIKESALENGALDHRWINHTTSISPLHESEPTGIKWLEKNAFDVESIPYTELASIGEDVILVEEADSVDGRINSRIRRVQKGPAPTAVTKHKSRPLTALPVDFEGIMDSPEVAAAAVGVELAPGPTQRLRRQRHDQQDGAMSPEVETRLTVAVVIVRTLTGGLDQQVDWVLIHSLFPDFSINYLSKTFKDMTRRKKAMVEKLGDEFKEPFLEAYGAGELGYLNYDKLLDYDWNKLISWVMKNVSVEAEMETLTLPATRDELEDEFDMEMIDEKKSWRDIYYGLTAPVYRRVENVAAYPYTTPLESHPALEEVDDFTLAKSWARAAALTPEEAWDVYAVQDRLKALGDLGNDAITALTSSRVLVHKSRQKRALPGRSLSTSVQFADCFRKHISDSQLIEAANFKAFLDAKFADPDGEARRDGIKFNTLADEGTVMCVTNLHAQGRINLVPINVPNNRFGLTGGGYVTRKLDKRKFHFDILIFPSPTYLLNEQIPELHNLTKMKPPRSGPRGELPVWSDINQRLMSGLWRKVVIAILGIVSLRAGINVESLQKELAPAMEVWELRLFTKWAVDVGALTDVGEYMAVNAHEEMWVEGWSTGEWWWLLGGMVSMR